MTHDPRCPSLRYVVLGQRVCMCEAFAEVAEAAYAAGWRNAEAAHVALVKAVGFWTDKNGQWIGRGDAIAAIKGDQP